MACEAHLQSDEGLPAAEEADVGIDERHGVAGGGARRVHQAESGARIGLGVNVRDSPGIAVDGDGARIHGRAERYCGRAEQRKTTHHDDSFTDRAERREGAARRSGRQGHYCMSMANSETNVAGKILELERAALERWGRGDPDGFLEISAPEVSYFDPFINHRLDGVDALRSWYDQIRGSVHIDRFEMIDPRVQADGDVAVLTFRFESHGSEGAMRWNTTEVYRLTAAGWRIIHTHWALPQPQLAGKPE